MKASMVWIVLTLALSGIAGPAGAAGGEHVEIYDGAIPVDDSFNILSRTRTCTGTGLISISTSCRYGPAYIIETSLSTRFTLPFLGSGSTHLNLQERTPVVGDYVTFHDKTCTSLLVVTDTTIQCFGGFVRSWHTSEYHNFFGEHRWNCGSALHCTAKVEAIYQ